MTDLETGYLVRASSRVMFHAQLLGSVIGVSVCNGIYRLFTITYEIPGDDFPLPLAHMWTNTPRLAAGDGRLPQGAMPVVLAGFLLSAGLRVLGNIAGDRHWKVWVPSGTAISIGATTDQWSACTDCLDLR